MNEEAERQESVTCINFEVMQTETALVEYQKTYFLHLTDCQLKAEKGNTKKRNLLNECFQRIEKDTYPLE